MKKFRIGVDVGGTNIKLALVDNQGNISFSQNIPTRAEMGYEYTVNAMIEAIKTLINNSKTSSGSVEAIGFGFPGQIDYTTGIVRHATNVPGWDEIPLAKMIEKEFNIPTRIDNDVRCATLGEFHYGAGKGCQNIVCITVGTGIGGGIILNGKIIRGASNSAGEIGHMKLEMIDGPLCGCGDRGCFEAFASGPSIVAMAQEYIKGGKSTKYREMTEGEITPYIVAQAALQGDAVAKRIFTVMGEYLGIGLANVVNLLNPEKIIIGGGVADAGDILFTPIRETINKRALAISAEAVQVVPAQLGNSAGLIGASLLGEQ